MNSTGCVSHSAKEIEKERGDEQQASRAVWEKIRNYFFYKATKYDGKKKLKKTKQKEITL